MILVEKTDAGWKTNLVALWVLLSTTSVVVGFCLHLGWRLMVWLR